MNNTRIKITADCNSESYQCQYYCGLLWWWQDMHIDFETLAEFGTIEEAQRHIDQWMIRQAEYKDSELVKKQKKKKKTKKITYVVYP